MASRWEDLPRYRRGPPAVVFFHGFEANTATLEHCGWRIAERVEMEVAYRQERVELVLYAPGGGLKISGSGFVDRERQFMTREENYPIVIQARECMNEAMVRILEGPEYVTPLYREIDMSHTIMDRIVSLQWGSIFPPRSESREDVFVAKADMGVVEHLEAIKRLQAPKQKELRAKADRQAASAETVARLIQVA